MPPAALLEFRDDGPARMDTELRKNVLDMMPHRVRAHVELFGNLPVRSSPREQPRDLRLTLGQPEPPEAELRVELAFVGEAHRHSHLERGKQEFEQRSRSVSRARAPRTY